jgi:tRNA threonylcarbamoyladenosine biosynthesis protein TsaE
VTILARTTGPEQTRELAGSLAGLASGGDVLLLRGDLGAGKTVFVQGYGRTLGIEDPITSPTFTLANQYHGDLDVHHLDAYRLEQLAEVIDLGLFDLLDDESVVLVEWGDVVAPVLAADYLEVTLRFGETDDERRLALEPVGERWMARRTRLAEAVAPWGDVPC